MEFARYGTLESKGLGRGEACVAWPSQQAAVYDSLAHSMAKRVASWNLLSLFRVLLLPTPAPFAQQPLAVLLTVHLTPHFPPLDVLLHFSMCARRGVQVHG